MSRVPPIPRSQLVSDEQRDVHDTLHAFADAAHSGQGFAYHTLTPDPALLGPFPIYIHATPTYAKPLTDAFLAFGTAIGHLPGLPPAACETGILTIAAHFGGGYPQYSHERKAWSKGVLTKAQTQAIAAGRDPGSKSEAGKDAEETEVVSMAWRVARELCRGGALRQEVYDNSLKVLGKDGTMALVHTCGFYMYVSALGNAFDVPVPEGDGTAEQ